MNHGTFRSARATAVLSLGAAALALLASVPLADSAGAMAQPTEWHSAEIHGHRMFYATRGSGPTLVFLHGGGDSGENSFVRQLDVFSER
jgi:hypothetical protein